jgi:hypothetical protein
MDSKLMFFQVRLKSTHPTANGQAPPKDGNQSESRFEVQLKVEVVARRAETLWSTTPQKVSILWSADAYNPD